MGQCTKVWHSVLLCGRVYSCVVQYTVVWGIVLLCRALYCNEGQWCAMWCSVMLYEGVYYVVTKFTINGCMGYMINTN